MRKLIAVALMSLLAACQSVPHRPGFSAKQVAALEQIGFKPAGDDWSLGIADRLLFETNQAVLIPENATSIGRLAPSLLAVGIHGARVEGHTDAVGTTEYNQQLSLRRAEAVKAELVKNGMAAGELRVAGMGETDPIDTNDTEAGRAQNRRVVIVVSPADAMKL